MKIKITLNEDHIELVKHLLFRDYNTKVGIDKHSAFDLESDFVFQAIAIIIGLGDHVRPETINDWDGPKYDDIAMERMIPLAEFLDEHLLDVEEILHQFCNVGLRKGTYWCLDNQHIWHYEGDETKKAD